MLEINGQRLYRLRNNINIRVPYCRLETYKKSFFPRTISLWNGLVPQVKASDSYVTFKSCFKAKTDEFEILYYYGDRWPAVHHARMRMGCSKLNYDLYHNLLVVESPACPCGFNQETAEHFLLHCHLWDEERLILYDAVQHVIPVAAENLFGCRDVDLDINKVVFKAVHSFIKTTKRFA